MKEKKGKVYLFWFIKGVCIGICFLFFPSVAKSQTQDTSYYIENFGRVLSDNVKVKRANRVLRKLLQKTRRLPYVKELVILPNDAAGWVESWAMAVGDKNIILVERVLDLCFKDVPEERGNARLAFILGHEISHLFHDLDEITEKPLNFKNLNSIAQAEIARTRENRADRNGVLTMLLAGYDPEEILLRDETDFFDSYENNVRKKILLPDKPETFPQKRTSQLRSELTQIIKEVKLLLKKGNQAYQEKNYEKAIHNYQEIYEVFPSREITNNLDLSHYQNRGL